MHAERWQPRATLVSFVLTVVVAGALATTTCREQCEVEAVVALPASLTPHSVTTRLVAPCTYEPEMVELLEQIAEADIAIERTATERSRELGYWQVEAARLRLVLQMRRLDCGADPRELSPPSPGCYESQRASTCDALARNP
jgi:hypothetical protein